MRSCLQQQIKKIYDMSLFEKIKKTLSCIGFVAREIWESAKGYFALGMLSIVVGAAVPLVLIQILGSIVDRLMTGDFQAALGGRSRCARLFL